MTSRLRRLWFKPLYAVTLVLTPWFFLPKVGAWFLDLGHWWLCILLRAYAITMLSCPITIWLARRFGILDIPAERKLHAQPMPRLGGLAVLAGVFVPTLAYARESVPLAAILAGAVAVYLLAAFDDVRSLSASFRLWVQLGLCLMLILAGVRLTTVPYWVPGEEWLNGALTALWVIGLLNAVNFLDGIDGLAASLGVVLVLGLSLTHEAPASELLAESATRSFEPHGLTFGPRAAPAPVPAEPEPASAPARLVYRPAPRPSAGAPGPYVDTLMPVATWRAISQAEQQLIERWDLSREKALGAASLEDWLDRHAAAAGVDAARLKTKLHRDV